MIKHLNAMRFIVFGIGFILAAYGISSVSLAQSGSAILPNGVCSEGIDVSWGTPQGGAAKNPVVGGAYEAWVDFSQDPDCADKVTAEVQVIKDGAVLKTCNSVAVTASATLVKCAFTASAGSYSAKVSYKPTSGAGPLVVKELKNTPFIVGATSPNNNNNNNGVNNNNTPGGPADTGGSTGGVIGTISNPISYDSLGALVVGIIRFLLTMLGGLAVLFIIIGAVRMVTSAGNEKAVTAGKQTVTWAVIGLITALMAFSVISLVQSVIGRK